MESGRSSISNTDESLLDETGSWSPGLLQLTTGEFEMTIADQLFNDLPDVVENRVIDIMQGECRLTVTSEGNVKVSGHDHRDAKLVAYQKSSNGTATIAVKFTGYSFNPGSKYSGLTTRVPPETVVYNVNTMWSSVFRDTGGHYNKSCLLLATALLTIDHSRKKNK